jgi:hypothetical protein
MFTGLNPHMMPLPFPTLPGGFNPNNPYPSFNGNAQPFNPYNQTSQFGSAPGQQPLPFGGNAPNNTNVPSNNYSDLI